MKHILEFRHRPQLNEDFLEKHIHFLDSISEISGKWCVNPENMEKPSDIAGEFISVVQLKNILPKGYNGQICYSLRHKDYLMDVAQTDDSISIRFNPKKVDYVLLVKSVFPRIAEAFECYRATIADDTLSLNDFKKILESINPENKDIDGRDTVYRINPVNFYDAELCRRAFDLTPQQIYDRLNGKIEHVSLLRDGVFIVYSSEILNDAEFEQVDGKIRALLGI